MFTAGEGRTVPIHPSLSVGPGGMRRLIKPGDLVELDDSHPEVVRMTRNGDLVDAPKGAQAGDTLIVATTAPTEK